MRKLAVLTVIALSVVMLCGTSTAEAHLVTKSNPKKHRSEHIAKSQEQNLAHARYVCKYGKRQNKKIHCKFVKWLKKEHAQTLAKLDPFYGRPPHYDQWVCIHGYEGSWTDDNAPHWGGLQMDYSFMRTYGPELLRSKGTANNWTPLEQMWVAERAHRGYGGHGPRGFTPWPNTARYCGLI